MFLSSSTNFDIQNKKSQIGFNILGNKHTNEVDYFVCMFLRNCCRF